MYSLAWNWLCCTLHSTPLHDLPSIGLNMLLTSVQTLVMGHGYFLGPWHLCPSGALVTLTEASFCACRLCCPSYYHSLSTRLLECVVMGLILPLSSCVGVTAGDAIAITHHGAWEAPCQFLAEALLLPCIMSLMVLLCNTVPPDMQCLVFKCQRVLALYSHVGRSGLLPAKCI